MTALLDFARPAADRFPGFPCIWSHADRTDSSHRYVLWRVWDERLPSVQWIGLKTSTADEDRLDPTVTRCMRWARAWGYGSFVMTNLFAFRSPHPAVMKAAPDPVGPDNDVWLERMSRCCGLVLAAWGNDGAHLDRARKFVDMRAGKGLPPLMCLGTTLGGALTHPLARGRARVPDGVRPAPWPIPAGWAA